MTRRMDLLTGRAARRIAALLVPVLLMLAALPAQGQGRDSTYGPQLRAEAGESAKAMAMPAQTCSDLNVVISGPNNEAAEGVASGLQPVWHPDGQHLVYFNTGAFKIVKKDGTGERFAFTNIGAGMTYGYDWYPDGQTFVYAHRSDGPGQRYNLWRVLPNSGESRQVPLSTAYAEGAWNPYMYGGNIFVLATTAQNTDPDLYRLQGIDLVMVHDNNEVDVDFAISSAGVIYLVRHLGHATALFRVEPNGSEVQITPDGSQNPAIAPNGDLYYQFQAPGSQNEPSIRVLRTDGTDTEIVAAGLYPDVNSNGGLAYTACPPPRMDVAVSMAANPQSVGFDEPMELTLTMTSTGDIAASGVLTTTIPSGFGLELVEVRDGGTYDQATRTVSWNFAGVTPGNKAIARVVVEFPSDVPQAQQLAAKGQASPTAIAIIQHDDYGAKLANGQVVMGPEVEITFSTPPPIPPELNQIYLPLAQR